MIVDFQKPIMVQEKNYATTSAILEKRLTVYNSSLSGKLTIHYLTDLRVYHDQQLAEVGDILEESVDRERKALKLI